MIIMLSKRLSKLRKLRMKETDKRTDRSIKFKLGRPSPLLPQVRKLRMKETHKRPDRRIKFKLRRPTPLLPQLQIKLGTPTILKNKAVTVDKTSL